MVRFDKLATKGKRIVAGRVGAVDRQHRETFLRVFGFGRL